VGELVARYIKDREAKQRAIRTTSGYRDILKRYIAPKIGQLSVGKLNALHVSEMLNAWSETLSPKTCAHIRSLLNGALDWAVKHDLVARNVVKLVDAITVPGTPAQALSTQQAQALLEGAKASRFGPFFALALATGARRGELCALRWSDISDNGKSMTIARATIEKTNDNGTRTELMEKSTKSGKVRVVPLNALAMFALKQQRSRQLEENMAARDVYEDSGHIFQTEIGGAETPYRFTDAFRKLCRKLKIRASLHSLRHTAASWLLAEGVDIITVSAILGHANPSITLNVYAHLLPGASEAAISAIDRRLNLAT
jgi:integrase